MKLTPEQTASIRTAFAEMQSREDLLTLLNRVCWMLEGSPKSTRLQDLIDAEEPLKWEIPEKYRDNNFITEKQLGFFSTSFKESAKKRKRYKRFYITKKNGSQREINAPVRKLLEIQRALNCMLKAMYTVQEPAFGFAPGKTIAGNAAGHVGKKFILNADIKDFFPSIHFRRVKIMLEKAPFDLTGEREPLAFLIANLCTENDVLPQGAATSPLLTNIICQRLDKKLQALAQKFNVYYSRYADDLSFSSNEYVFSKRFMNQLEAILESERFQLNPEKTRVQGKAYRQEVTGLTVNEKLNINRHYLRNYRTLVYLYKTKGEKAAREYLFKKKPARSALLELVRRLKKKGGYIRNVITGKYNFIKQVKGADAMRPPFEIAVTAEEPKVKIFKKADKIYGVRNEEDRKEEEQMQGSYKEMLDDSADMAAESVMLYGDPGKQKKSSNAKLIENVLGIWEQQENGFKNAMELLKKATE
ncbi:MAG: reverse transcriptase family protein [Ferruginibacter sp.]